MVWAICSRETGEGSAREPPLGAGCHVEATAGSPAESAQDVAAARFRVNVVASSQPRHKDIDSKRGKDGRKWVEWFDTAIRRDESIEFTLPFSLC